MTTGAPPSQPRRATHTARWVVIAASVLFMGIVVYRSLQVAGHECSVCVEFHGREMCRTVQGASGEEAARSAMNNACAQLASGVTDTMACERSKPTKMECRTSN
ncbi:MAG TPA: hypothetical protein VEB21_13690 [Terriglobales bacterium]|nr:hypothetical protein [Terriglobales bacterium]